MRPALCLAFLAWEASASARRLGGVAKFPHFMSAKQNPKAFGCRYSSASQLGEGAGEPGVALIQRLAVRPGSGV